MIRHEALVLVPEVSALIMPDSPGTIFGVIAEHGEPAKGGWRELSQLAGKQSSAWKVPSY